VRDEPPGTWGSAVVAGQYCCCNYDYLGVGASRELYPASEASWRVLSVLLCSGSGMAGADELPAIYEYAGFYAAAFAAGVTANLANLAIIGALAVRQSCCSAIVLTPDASMDIGVGKAGSHPPAASPVNFMSPHWVSRPPHRCICTLAVVPTFGGRLQQTQLLRCPKMLESAKLG